MSDAKKCDRCGFFYEMRGEHNDIRPSLEVNRIFGVRFKSAANTNMDDWDLCPDCAKKVWEYVSNYEDPIPKPDLTEECDDDRFILVNKEDWERFNEWQRNGHLVNVRSGRYKWEPDKAEYAHDKIETKEESDGESV